MLCKDTEGKLRLRLIDPAPRKLWEGSCFKGIVTLPYNPVSIVFPHATPYVHFIYALKHTHCSRLCQTFQGKVTLPCILCFLAQAHARTHACMHARTDTHSRTHTRAPSCAVKCVNMTAEVVLSQLYSHNCCHACADTLSRFARRC